MSPSVTERIGNNEDNCEDNLDEDGSQPRAGSRRASWRGVLIVLFFKLFTLFPQSSLTHSIPKRARPRLRNQHRLRSSLTTHLQTSLSCHARLSANGRITSLQQNGGITVDQFAIISAYNGDFSQILPVSCNNSLRNPLPFPCLIQKMSATRLPPHPENNVTLSDLLRIEE